MHKFTLFSILFSISVVLLLLDVLLNDYLTTSPPFAEATQEESVTLPEGFDESQLQVNTLGPDVQLSEEQIEAVVADLESLPAQLDEARLASIGFDGPVLKEAIYSGLIFQFLSFADQEEAYIYQSNFFNGSEFIGSIYEIRYPSETASFQGYLALRERAQSQSRLGELNEVNLYGDASFYFNHFEKTKTVHLVIRRGDTLYAFEYAYRHHELMKKLFDAL